MKNEGLSADAAVFDVTDPQGVERGVASIEQEIGPIDVLVNNAGVQRRAPLEDFPPETWRELMRTNLDAVFYVGQAVAKRMIPAGRDRSSTSPPCRANSRGPISRPTRPQKAP